MVASELGQARLHLNANASSLNTLILERSDVRTYLHRAIKSSYRASHCQNLASPISLEAVLDILGETAFQLQRDRSGDLFDIELLEEIAWLICDRFAGHVRELLKRSDAWQNGALTINETNMDGEGTEGIRSNIDNSGESRSELGHNVHINDNKGSSPSAAQSKAAQSSAQIISFPDYKIRRANARL